MGLRYLRASPKRGFVSLIAGIAIFGLSLGVAVLIVVLSVMNGFEEELRTRILSLTAHATISGLEGRIADWRPQVEKVSHFPGVVAAAPYIEEQAMMTRGDKSAGVLMRGVLPDAERRVADLSRHLLAGHLSDLVPGQYRVILGKALAESLNARVGDRVVLMVRAGRCDAGRGAAAHALLPSDRHPGGGDVRVRSAHRARRHAGCGEASAHGR